MINVALVGISVFINYFYGPFPTAATKVFYEYASYFYKLLITFVAMQFILLTLCGRMSSRPAINLAIPIVIWALIQVAYFYVQRVTGVNLVYGLSETLPDNRRIFGDIYRVSGFMNHPLSLAYSLTLILCAALLFARSAGLAKYATIHRNINISGKYAWLFVAFVLAASIILTNSRWPLAIVGFSFLIYALAPPISRRSIKALSTGMAIIVIALWIEGGILVRMSELFHEGSIIDIRQTNRFKFLQVHWQMFLEHPVSGVGYFARHAARPIYYDKLGFGDMTEIYPAHNVFIQILSDCGVIGFLGLIGFMGSILIAAGRLKSLTGSGFPVYFIFFVMFLSTIAQDSLRDSEYLYGLWAIIGLVVIEEVKRHHQLRQQRR